MSPHSTDLSPPQGMKDYLHLILICPNFMEGYSLSNGWSNGSCLTKADLRLVVRSNLDRGRFLLPSIFLGVVSFKCHKMSFLMPENLSSETVKLWGKSVFEISLSLFSTEFLKIILKWYLGLVLSSFQGDGSPWRTRWLIYPELRKKIDSDSFLSTCGALLRRFQLRKKRSFNKEIC